MFNNKKILALVPARSGSKGVPDKNIRVLCGHPMLSYPIETAIGSKYVDRVILSTDSEVYAEIGRQYGAEVPFLRPQSLANDFASSIDVILHAVDFCANEGDLYDYILLLEPTSPLTESADVDRALEVLINNQVGAKSLVGVTLLESQHPAFTVKIEDERLKPYNADSFSHLPRRQDIEELYALDGSLYCSDIEKLREARSFCHDSTLPFVMPKYKSYEVDDIADFYAIEAMLNNMDSLKNSNNE